MRTTTDSPKPPRTGLGRAWLGLAVALAVHVADEAANDFLSVYNPTVTAIRESYPWLVLPVFDFPVWIGGLAVAVVLLLLLSKWAFGGARWLIWISLPLSILMLLNALGHLGSSAVTGRWMPGVYSSPLLMACSLWLLIAALRARRHAA